MSQKRKKEGKSYTKTLYRLFTRTNIEEIRDIVKDGESVNEDGKRGVKNSKPGSSPRSSDEGGGDREGDWREKWEDSMQEQSDQNTEMIYENRELLERLDERSAWTMRLLVGVFVTILGSAALQVFIL